MQSRLRHRVTLQRLTDQDTWESSENWETVGTYWAEVTPLVGRELNYAKQIAETVDTRIDFRAGVGPITTVDRLVYDDKIYNITSVINVQERDKVLQVFCSEEVE